MIASNEVQLIVDYDDLKVVQDDSDRLYFLDYDEDDVKELEIVAEVKLASQEFNEDDLLSGTLAKYGLEDYEFDINGEDSGYYLDEPTYYYFRIKQ
jgi:hypothetical protein